MIYLLRQAFSSARSVDLIELTCAPNGAHAFRRRVYMLMIRLNTRARTHARSKRARSYVCTHAHYRRPANKLFALTLTAIQLAIRCNLFPYRLQFECINLLWITHPREPVRARRGVVTPMSLESHTLHCPSYILEFSDKL